MSAPDIFSVQEKSAFVTGAALGLGRAMAEVLAENGARVALFDRDAAALDNAVSTLEAQGGNVIGFSGDVTNADDVNSAVSEAENQIGKLDIAIANAGISDATGALLHESDPDDWRRVMSVNLDGLYHFSRAALTSMVESGAGKLITVASMWGLAAPAGLQARPAYAASKGAVVNLTRELALEYAAHNIQINAICPGFFRTETRPRNAAQEKQFKDYTPMGRIAEMDEIKGTVLYLASSASDFVTGTSLVVDGGILAR